MTEAKDCRIVSTKSHGFFFTVAVVALVLVWQPPDATAFSIGRINVDLPSRTTTVAFASRKAKGDNNPGRSVVSEMKRSESEGNENNNNTDGTTSRSPETKTSTSMASHVADVSAAVDTPSVITETDGFSGFAANQTPLLAELLALNKDGNDSALLASPPSMDHTTVPTTITVVSRNVEDDYDSVQIEPWTERSSELIVVALATCSLVGIMGDILSNYEWVQNLRYFWPLSIGAYYGLLWNQAYNEKGVSLQTAVRREFGPSVAFTPTAASGDAPGTLLLQLGYVFGGFGLFFGGLADAVLPVWMTGPNWITNAGLAPDCAVLLLVLSVGEEYNLFGNKNNNNDGDGGEGIAVKNVPDDKRGKNNPRSGDGESLLVASSSSRTDVNDAMAVMTPLLLRITLWAELYKLGESSLEEVFGGLQTLLSSST